MWFKLNCLFMDIKIAKQKTKNLKNKLKALNKIIYLTKKYNLKLTRSDNNELIIRRNKY